MLDFVIREEVGRSHEASKQIGVRRVVRITKSSEIPSTPKTMLMFKLDNQVLSSTNC